MICRPTAWPPPLFNRNIAQQQHKMSLLDMLQRMSSSRPWLGCKRKSLVYINWHESANQSSHGLVGSLLIKELKSILEVFTITRPVAIYVKCTGSCPPPLFVSEVQDLLHCDKNRRPEFTLETEPFHLKHLTEQLNQYHDVGVNRLSLLIADSIQILQQQERDMKIFNESFSRGVAADITLPCQCYQKNIGKWISLLKDVAEHTLSHIKLEEIFCQKCSGNRECENWFANQYNVITHFLESLGFHEYKLFHYTNSRPSEYMLHMSRGCEYVGIGPGSHGRLDERLSGFRIAYINERDPNSWADKVLRSGKGVYCSRSLSRLDWLSELLLHDLDTVDGVSSEDWIKCTNGLPLCELKNLAPLKNYIADGMLEIRDRSLVISRRFWPFSNTIIATIVNCIEDKI